jgi:hypothetical protein
LFEVVDAQIDVVKQHRKKLLEYPGDWQRYAGGVQEGVVRAADRHPEPQLDVIEHQGHAAVEFTHD